MASEPSTGTDCVVEFFEMLVMSDISSGTVRLGKFSSTAKSTPSSMPYTAPGVEYEQCSTSFISGDGKALPRIWLAIDGVNRLHGELAACFDSFEDVVGDGLADFVVGLIGGVADEGPWSWAEVVAVTEGDANVEVAVCAEDPHDVRGRAAMAMVSAYPR